MTALMVAARDGHAEMVEVLIQAGADVNLRTNYLVNFCNLQQNEQTKI